MIPTRDEEYDSLMLTTILLLATLAGNWTTHGPDAGRTPALGSGPDARIVYAGNNAGVFRSDDGGQSWRDVSGGFGNVTVLAVDPTDTDTVFAAMMTTAYVGKVYKTTDGGAHWAELELDQRLTPRAILINPSNPDIVYIGSGCLPYFVNSGPRAEYFEAAGVLRSTDGGSTWQNVKEASCIQTLTLDPRTPWHLFARSDFSTEESFDGGSTWLPAGLVPTVGVVAHPTEAKVRYGIRYASYDSQGFPLPLFLTSVDNGVTWTPVTTTGLTGIQYTSLNVDPASGRIFVGSDEGLFASSDGGRSWERMPTLPRTLVSGVAINSTGGSLVVATAFGVYGSTFPAGTASLLDTHDAATTIERIVADPGDPLRLFASTIDAYPNGRIFRSKTGGLSWERIDGPDLNVMRLLSADAAGDLYATHSGGAGLYRLRRDGQAFETLPNLLSPGIYGMVADPTRAGTVYVIANGGLLRTRDGGMTWDETYLGDEWPFHLIHHPTRPDVVIATGLYVLYRTTDGSHYEQLPIPENDGAFAFAPSRTTVLYGAFRNPPGHGIHILGRSDDGGKTWTLRTGPITGRITALTVDPHDDNRVWAATPDGIYLTTDAGLTWTDATDDLPTRAVQSLTLDPLRGTLHLGTDRGVWSRFRPGRRRAVR
jgi:photosystem II stability/assembly factor-like uncharacterized protein